MLTPIDIEMKEFKKAIVRGYSINDVNEFLDEVLKSFETIHRENIELKDKMVLLNENISYFKSMEETLKNTLVLAEKTAQETKTAAYQKSEQIVEEGAFKSDQMIQDARQEVYEITKEINELQKQHKYAKIQIRKMLETQMEMLEDEMISQEDEIIIEEDAI
ncbi:MAG TPA: DivIVA domain-containing protein [Clostridiales bacterium]|nr:DivIVA domain-containing protein [Clostridiales bacterium]